jgi:uncharacterized protein YpmB
VITLRSKALLVGIAVVCAVIVFWGSRYVKSPGVTSDGVPMSQDQAIALAKRETPLREVNRAEPTHFLPIRHVITGTDEKGREVVVWVRAGIEKTVYLDQLQVRSKESAISLSTQFGINRSQITHVELGYLDRDGQPIVWHVVTPERQLMIDATTKALVTLK